jgi:hypothetical protein
MDPNGTIASAFGIADSRFCAVGSDREVLQLCESKARITNLKGQTVVPGLIETHSHLSLYAMTLLQTNCRTPPNSNLAEVKARLKDMALDLGSGQWVRGWGFDDTLIVEKRHLTRHDLDEVCLHNPVFISHTSGHLAYVNSAAMQAAAITPGTPDPDGGKIDRDIDGMPNGLLMEEAAQSLVLKHIPLYSVAQLKSAMERAIRYYHQFGITSAHDAAIGYFRHQRPVIQAYRELEAEGKLTLRTYLTIVESVYRTLLQTGLGTGMGSNGLKLGAVKLFQDGSIQALTAALSKPYFNRGKHRGNLILPQKTLNLLVEEYHREGVQIAIHTNGDRAIDSALQALSMANRLHPRKKLRHMLIHCQLATSKHLQLMKKLGVIPSFFVNHVHYWGDRHRDIFLGPDRAAGINPLHLTMKQGMIFSLHSDLPVTPVEPMFSMQCAVNRMTSGGEVLGPNQRIPVIEALKAYTSYAAHCSFEEDSKGSIEAGKLADFAVLSANPLAVAPHEIGGITVLQTVVGGKTVYESF